MKNEFICFVKFITDIDKGFRFLENFINIKTKNSISHSFPPSRYIINEGIIDFNAYKKQPEGLDNLQIMNWRERNWGCINIPYLEMLNIDINDYWCCREHYEEIVNIDIYNSSNDDNNNNLRWRINWFNEHDNVDYYNKHIHEIFKMVKDECNEDNTENETHNYIMTIELKFLTDDVPLYIFKHWKDKYYEYNYYGVDEDNDDDYGFNVELISFNDYIIRYNFTDKGYNYEEINMNNNPEEFYETALKRECLNKGKVFASIRGKLNELIKDNNKYKFNINELALQIEKALYILDDNHETVAKIITLTNKLYNDYLKNQEAK